MVDPMWAIEMADRGEMSVEEFLDTYNLLLPTKDAM